MLLFHFETIKVDLIWLNVYNDQLSFDIFVNYILYNYM